jgi:dienelactone hydrolase
VQTSAAPMPRFLSLVFAALAFVATDTAAAELLTAARVTDLRVRIRDNFFIDPLPPLAPQTHRRFSPAPGVQAEAVTYATQFGQRVPAILYLPARPSGKIPALIVVNGHGGDKYSWYAFYAGIVYARAGFAVLTYDPAGEGERSGTRHSGTREHDKLQGDVVMARRLAGLMMTDVMQAVSFLSQRPEVDAARIAAGGYSMGSFVLALTGAVEPRLRACVLVGGGNLDGPDAYWDRAKPMCQGGPYRSLAFLGDRPAVLYALHAARGPLLIWNGRADSVVNMPNTQEPFFDDLRARVVAQRGTAEGVFEFGLVDGTSHRPYFVTKPVAFWLAQQLIPPASGLAAMRALPETRIGDWAARHVDTEGARAADAR